MKSADLSQATSAADTIQRNFRNCLARGKDAVSHILPWSQSFQSRESEFLPSYK